MNTVRRRQVGHGPTTQRFTKRNLLFAGGYTIIEVSLFLGISGLLFTVAIFATGSTIRNARFSDSGRSLEAYVQKQYDNLLTGVNPRSNDVACVGGTVSSGTQTPGTSNCLLIGKLLVFQIGNYSIMTYDIVASDPGVNVNYGQTDEQLIANDFRPQVVTTVNVLPYSIPWQAPITGVKRVNDGVAANALALIRSPRSTRVVAYSYKETGATPAQDFLANSGVLSGQIINYCLRSADGFGATAKLVIGRGGNQGAARTEFNAATGDCDGA